MFVRVMPGAAARGPRLDRCFFVFSAASIPFRRHAAHAPGVDDDFVLVEPRDAALCMDAGFVFL